MAKSREKETFLKPNTKVLSPLHNKNNFFDSNNHQEKQTKPQNINPKETYETVNNLIAIEKSNLVSVSTLHEQTRIGGQKLGEQPVRMQQLKPKTIQN